MGATDIIVSHPVESRRQRITEHASARVVNPTAGSDPAELDADVSSNAPGGDPYPFWRNYQPLGYGLRADVHRIVDQAMAAHGRIDVLVNNAGVGFHRPALEVPDEEFATVFDVNVTGLWRMTKAVAPHMIDAGGGAIVNVGSISAMIVNRPQWQPAYNASKAAVHQFTKSLAAEWAPYHIRVNAIAPGYVKTEMAPVDEPRFRQHWIEDAPMRRYATPQEIAPSVVYLASDAVSFTTGAVLVTDGGYTLH
jgi:NAD(P)-dependent dehydrogenase (short-subunit alcohol dehydrogenase family)